MGSVFGSIQDGRWGVDVSVRPEGERHAWEVALVDRETAKVATRLRGHSVLERAALREAMGAAAIVLDTIAADSAPAPLGAA